MFPTSQGTSTIYPAIKQRSLIARFRSNALSYGYGQFVTILIQLALVPVFLKFWGTARYADWLVLSGIPTMLTLLDLGVAQASNNKATMRAGAGDWVSVRCSLQTAFLFTITLGCTIVFITLFADHFLDLHSLLNLKTLDTSDAALIMMILSMNLALQLMGGPIDGWFRAMDRTALGAFLISSRRMTDFLVTLVVLWLGGGLVHLATSILVSQLLMLVLLIVVANHFSPLPLLGFSDASWSEFRYILKPALAYMSFPVSQTITLQGGIQILNQVSDASVLVGFTMARTLMRLIIQFGVVANNSLKPEISRLAGKGDMASARRGTARLTRAIIGASTMAYVIAVFSGPRFINWWGHAKVSVSSGMLALVGIHTVVNVAWFVPAALLIATNQHARVATAYLSSSVVALVAWIALSAVIPPIAGASMLLALPEFMVLILFYYKGIGQFSLMGRISG